MNPISTIFLNSGSIFYLPFLFSGVVITVLWLRTASGLSLAQAFGFFLQPRLWINKQTCVDLLCFIFILFGISKLVISLNARVFDVVISLEKYLPEPAARSLSFNLTPISESLMAAGIVMLAYDFASYWTHRLMHRNPWLWRIHRFHHSAEQLTFFTTYRQHPLEPLVLGFGRSVFSALSLSLFYYFFPSRAPVFSIAGLGAGFFAYMFTVNLHHSPVSVRYPKFLRQVLVSPHVHHLHHGISNPVPGTLEGDNLAMSEKGQAKNFGVIFSFWDRWFQTYFDPPTNLRTPPSSLSS